MSRTRTLQMLLFVSATAWVLILGALGGMIAMHVFDGPRTVQAPHVTYEHVYRQTATHRGCCPPPPCCPRSHVTYVAHTTTPPRTPWPFLLTGLLAGSAIVTGLVARRRLAPMQP